MPHLLLKKFRNCWYIAWYLAEFNPENQNTKQMLLKIEEFNLARTKKTML